MDMFSVKASRSLSRNHQSPHSTRLVPYFQPFRIQEPSGLSIPSPSGSAHERNDPLLPLLHFQDGQTLFSSPLRTFLLDDVETAGYEKQRRKKKRRQHSRDDLYLYFECVFCQKRKKNNKGRNLKGDVILSVWRPCGVAIL